MAIKQQSINLLIHIATLTEFIFFLSFVFWFLGPHPQHMEVPRLGAESELQLLAYVTATATRDPCHIYDLHHGSQQRQIPNLLREARD